jgi:uncharacterized integral membrane protein
MVTMEPSRTTGPAGESSGVAASAGAIAGGSGVAALLMFIFQNTDDVTVTFLFWTFSWPIWLLIIVSAALGAAIWLGLGIMRRRRRRKDRREARS